jgi:hypothetical protein
MNMNLRLSSVASAACLVLLSLPALAQETYTYTGNPLDITYVSGGGYNNTDKITGDFTLASALPDNMALTEITPLTYSFTDGVQTLTNTNSVQYLPPAFEVETNATGQIIDWNIVLTVPGTLDFINTSVPSIGVQDNAQVGTSSTIQGAVGNVADPGTFTASATATPGVTPEPSSLVLLGTGLLGAFAVTRRRLTA